MKLYKSSRVIPSIPTYRIPALCLIGLLALLLAADSYLLRRSVPPDTTPGAERSRIINEVAPLCWDMLSRNSDVRVAATRVLNLADGGPITDQWWTVECTEAHEQPLLFLMWNATQHRPYLVSRPRERAWYVDALNTPAQATAAARAWGMRLHMLTVQEANATACQANQVSGVWNVCLPRAGGTVLMLFDGRTGYLICATISHRSLRTGSPRLQAHAPAKAHNACRA